MTKHSGLGSIYLSHSQNLHLVKYPAKPWKHDVGLAFWYGMMVNVYYFLDFNWEAHAWRSG